MISPVFVRSAAVNPSPVNFLKRFSASANSLVFLGSNWCRRSPVWSITIWVDMERLLRLPSPPIIMQANFVPQPEFPFSPGARWDRTSAPRTRTPHFAESDLLLSNPHDSADRGELESR